MSQASAAAATIAAAGRITVDPCDAANPAGRRAFMDLGARFAARVPHSVPQLPSEQRELIDPARNPFFDHADVQLFIAHRDGEPVGRISAHIDRLALAQPPEQGMGPGTGNWGYFDATDDTVAQALIATAEDWLRGKGMTRVLAPISLSIWEEPGLLVRGHDHAPTAMMGHHPPHYRPWIEAAGYTVAKRLHTYELDISQDFPPLIQRIVQSGERNPRITLRSLDMAHYDRDIGIVRDILNDAWSANWGFVPFTDRELAYTAKKMKPILRPELVRFAELDGAPAAFMITIPDHNRALTRANGRLFPFGWLHLLAFLRKPTGADMRVPLMGVIKQLQNSRMAGQLAFMMIDQIRRNAHELLGSMRGEIGWILEDNQGMVAIAEAIDSRINREYAIFERRL